MSNSRSETLAAVDNLLSCMGGDAPGTNLPIYTDLTTVPSNIFSQRRRHEFNNNQYQQQFLFESPSLENLMTPDQLLNNLHRTISRTFFTTLHPTDVPVGAFETAATSTKQTPNRKRGRNNYTTHHNYCSPINQPPSRVSTQPLPKLKFFTEYKNETETSPQVQLEQPEDEQTVISRIFHNWRDYLNLDDNQLYELEKKNAQDMGVCDEMFEMICDQERYVWQLIDDIGKC